MMTKALGIFFLLLLSRPAFANYALVANTGAGSSDGNAVTTGAIDTTGANLLVIGITDYIGTASTCTPTDSKSNTWTAIADFMTGGSLHTKIWYSQGGTVGSGHTFSCSSMGTFPSITVSAWSGSVAMPLDQNTGATNDSTASLQPGSITPMEDNELVISVVMQNIDTGSVTVTGLTETSDIAAASGMHAGNAMGYVIQTTASAINPTWTASSSGQMAAAIASFKAAASGGGSSRRNCTLLGVC